MLVEAVNVTKYYGPRPALEGVSFAIDVGETVAFLGLRGSGKSSVLRLLAGYIEPTSGTVRVRGMNPCVPAAREAFGYLPEGNPLPAGMRVGEYLRFRAGIKGLGGRTAGAVAEALARCRLEDDANTMIGQLPVDARRRVGLADCVLGTPPILFLDDPVAGLDPRRAEETLALVAQLGAGATLIVASGVLHDASRLCRRAVFLETGRVALDGDLGEICERNVEERTIRLVLLTSEPVRETLRIIPGVRAVSVEPDPLDPAAVQVRITMPAGVDLRREISAICAVRGWVATDMRLEPVLLEDIFRRLSRG